jgi:glycosyltransferase involved in cell wall biosynthesis
MSSRKRANSRKRRQMKLTMVIATRNRPELLLRTVMDTLPNVSRKDTRILLAVDDDDQETIDCLKRLPKDDRLMVSVKPREDSRGEKYDRALTEATADVYLPAVDCAPIVTPAFDQKIINAARMFEDGIVCVHTPMVNGHFPPGLQAFTAEWVRQFGYIYNHEYPFWFIDHEADDIARLLCRYVPVDVRVNTAEMRPATTIRLRDLAFWADYYNKMTLERRLKVRQIINSKDFDGPPELKIALCNNYECVEQRSYMINNSVIANAAAIEAQRGDKSPPDAGYLRAKAKAEQKLARLLRLYSQAA